MPRSHKMSVDSLRDSMKTLVLSTHAIHRGPVITQILSCLIYQAMPAPLHPALPCYKAVSPTCMRQLDTFTVRGPYDKARLA